MNAWVHMDMDDIGMCGSCACKHVANMQDKLQTVMVKVVAIFIQQPLTRGMIVKLGGCAMMKNMSYMVTGRERRYIFLRCLLEKPLTHGRSQSRKITRHNF